MNQMQFHWIAATKGQRQLKTSCIFILSPTGVPFGTDEVFAAFSRVTAPVQMDLSELVNAVHSAARDVRRFLFGIVSRQIVRRCLKKTTGYESPSWESLKINATNPNRYVRC